MSNVSLPIAPPSVDHGPDILSPFSVGSEFIKNFAINGTPLDAPPVTISFHSATSRLFAYGEQIIVTYTSLSVAAKVMLINGYYQPASAMLNIQIGDRWITDIPITLFVEGAGSVLTMTSLQDTPLVTPLYPAQFY